MFCLMHSFSTVLGKPPSIGLYLVLATFAFSSAVPFFGWSQSGSPVTATERVRFAGACTRSIVLPQTS
jgi:hypothetical protein